MLVHSSLAQRLILLQPLLIFIQPVKAVDLTETQTDGTISVVSVLQRVLRKAEGHVDVTDLDTVLAGIADDLRRGIKAHRLRIQEAAAEGVGMVMLQPRRNIDKLCEARGM